MTELPDNWLLVINALLDSPVAWQKPAEIAAVLRQSEEDTAPSWPRRGGRAARARPALAPVSLWPRGRRPPAAVFHVLPLLRSRGTRSPGRGGRGVPPRDPPRPPAATRIGAEGSRTA